MNHVMVALLLSATLSGCATYQGRVSQARQTLLAGQCAEAVPQFSELTERSANDRLLFLMEEASALQICGEYEKSNEKFLEADRLSEQIDYHSVSRIAGATLLNEEMIQYKGDTFEKLFINASAALNYLQLGQYESALVEVRRINEKHRKFSTEDKKNFELNSFSQYISGLIWEIEGQFDDACIAYRAAYEIDLTFRQVGLDMLTACWRARRDQEFSLLEKKVQPTATELALIKSSRPSRNKKTKAKINDEVILIYLQGLGPRKVQSRGDRVDPYLSPTHTIQKRVSVRYTDTTGEELVQRSEIVYHVEKAAMATLEAEMSSLVARRLGARVAKEVVADQIRQKDKALGQLAWFVMVAAERADLRNWTLLPETIQVVRLKNIDRSRPLKIEALAYGDSVVGELQGPDLSESKARRVYLIRTIK